MTASLEPPCPEPSLLSLIRQQWGDTSDDDADVPGPSGRSDQVRPSAAAFSLTLPPPLSPSDTLQPATCNLRAGRRRSRGQPAATAGQPRAARGGGVGKVHH